MKKLIILFFFLLSCIVYGQTNTYDIIWEKNDSMIHFPQAVYGDHQQLLPKFAKNLQWQHEGMLPVAKVIVIRSSKVNPSYLDQLIDSELSSSPAIKYHIVYEKKRPVLQFTVTPFFIDKTSGEIHKVESFVLDLKAERPLSTLKSTIAGEYAPSSKLATHNWHKIAIEKSGIHKLSYEQIENLGISNVASVKIFGTGAILLPEDFTLGNYDDLTELPIYMDKGSDKNFGPGDFILFYARGPVSWNYNMGEDFFSQKVHNYSDRGYYFLTGDLGVSSPPRDVDISTEPTSTVVTTYDLLGYVEEKQYNLLNSGKEWYGDKFDITLEGAYPFTLDGLNTSVPLKIRVTVAARSNESSSFKVNANNSALGTIPIGTVDLSRYTSTYAKEESSTFSYTASNKVFTVSLEYQQPNSNSEGWLNHITVNGRGHIDLESSQLTFRDRLSAVFGTDSEFQVQNVGSSTLIWDVTDPGNPGNVPFQNISGSAVFKVSTDSLREFVAFNVNGSFPAPIVEGPGLGKIDNQNLHGETPAQMIVIYDEILEEEVSRFVEHRKTHDGLTVSTVTQEAIFNEFSSGTPNISAIRNYLKMHYDRSSPEEMTRYLLLFGDGTYDNKDTASYNPNLIMTFQSDNSLEPVRSFVSDDFFGMLDSGEEIKSGLLDIGIGRFPVSTPEEAQIVVDKIIAYDQVETLGEWRNYICFVGDDEDGNTHMRQANSLAETLENEYPNYNINKIFLDAYPQETTPTGDLYPAVTRALNEQMNRGALIINYTGHGGVTGLAHEKILDITNIKGWDNEGKLPLFMTATCEFSRYDEYNHLTQLEATSAGEEVLLNPVGGSIALFTTTRLVYSAQNHRLNEKFYEIVFEKDSNDQCYRLGDIIVFSKNNIDPGINKRNFTLLGDPSLSLSFPKNIIVTDSINNMAIESQIDTVSALDFVTVSGHVETQTGDPYNSFNGLIYPVVYDKKKKLVTLANDGGSPMEFLSRNTILYKGKSRVKNGRFSFGFYIPKDINYSIGSGKISYYSENGTDDAHGSTESLKIGGLGDLTVSDTAGPDIRLFMNDSLFKPGGIVTPSPELLIYVDDEYGINTTGNGIGHDITATLDDDRINAIILNEYYQSDIDQYASGSVRYPYKDLETGKHKIIVKVWDIFNNSKEKSLEFVVVESSEMLLSKIYNYPNPFIDQTWFNIEHNRPNQELEVIIRIYDINGTLATILSDIVYTPGYRLDPIPWNGRGHGGATLGGGLYVYKVYVKSETGEEAVGSGRLIIKR